MLAYELTFKILLIKLLLLLSLFFIVFWKTNPFPFVIFPCSLLIREQSMLSWKMSTILCRQWVLIWFYFSLQDNSFIWLIVKNSSLKKTCWPTDELKTVSWLMANCWPSLRRHLASSQLTVGWQVCSESCSSQLPLIFLNIWVATHLSWLILGKTCTNTCR